MSSVRWACGVHAVAAALTHDPGAVLELWIDAEARNPRLLELKVLAEGKGIAVQRVRAPTLDRQSGGVRHQGVIAKLRLAQAPAAALSTLLDAAGGAALLVLLDGVQDPHNLGACIRSAAAFGATAVIVPKDRAAGMSEVVARTAAGTSAWLPLIQVANLARCMEELRERGVWLYGASGAADESIYQQDWRGAVGLVLGSEGQGLRRLTRERCDRLVRIPIDPRVESLNVAVACGVLLAEVARQRQRASAGG